MQSGFWPAPKISPGLLKQRGEFPSADEVQPALKEDAELPEHEPVIVSFILVRKMEHA